MCVFYCRHRAYNLAILPFRKTFTSHYPIISCGKNFQVFHRVADSLCSSRSTEREAGSCQCRDGLHRFTSGRGRVRQPQNSQDPVGNVGSPAPHRSPGLGKGVSPLMKTLSTSLALAVSLGLCSAALAGECGSSAPVDPCCRKGFLHGLKFPSPCALCNGHSLSLPRIKLHRDCCEKPRPKPAPAPCDPCRRGHRLFSMLNRGCCTPKVPSPPKPKPVCSRRKLAWDPCHRISWPTGIFGKLHGVFSNRCCDPCAPGEGGKDAPAPAPAPAPKPMDAGANSNGLLILNPAG